MIIEQNQHNYNNFRKTKNLVRIKYKKIDKEIEGILEQLWLQKPSRSPSL